MRTERRISSIAYKMLQVITTLLFAVGLILYMVFGGRFYEVYRQQAFSHLSDVESLATENVSDLMEQLDQLSVSVLVDRVVQANLTQIDSQHPEAGKKEDSDPYFRLKAAISNQVQPSVFNVSGVVSLRIYSLSGEEIFVGTTNQEYLDYSLTPEEIYQANGAALWEMNGEKHYVCLCRAILSTNTMEPLGYLVLVCRNAYFSNRLYTISGAYSGRIYLLDESGRIIASSDPDMIGTEFPCSAAELAQQKKQLVNDPASGERSYYFLGDPLPNGWTLVTTVTQERMLFTLLLSLLIMAGVLLLVLVMTFLAANIAVERLSGPTLELLQGMQHFGAGELDTRVTVRSADEVGMIAEGYNQMADNIQSLLEHVYSLELANKEAEIEFLKMQINPHFLYNTLDTISWMGYTHGIEEISDLSVSLAQLLRSSIKNDSFVTVERELQSVRDYLNIQQYRFGDRIQVEYDIDEAVLKRYMPNFLLQPLIENSIIHGLESQMQQGVVRVRIWMEQGWLGFEISDNGTGMTDHQVETLMQECQNMSSRNSIGLKNVYRRLQLMVGSQSQFTILSQPGQGTTVSFRLPGDMKQEDE